MKENHNPEIDLELDDEAFEAELEALMKEDHSGKKKKKEKPVKEKGESKSSGLRKPWSRKRKLITALGTIVVLLLLFNALKGGKTPPQQMVLTTPVIRGDVSEMLSVSGPVSGTDSVDVVSNLHAEVLEILVKEGDKVKKDQLIASVDSTDIQKEVEIAQNTYNLEVSTYGEQQIAAENGYAKATQDYQASKSEFDRTNVLFQAGSVSQLELETVQNRLNDASRQLKTFTLKDGKPVANESFALQVKSAEFELEKKYTALENTKVKSPIDGTVVRVNAKVGRFADTIEDDKPMFIIENLELLEMKINVSEYSIGKIQMGQMAEISADILGGETITGQITAISPTGEEKGGGSTERVIPTTIRIEEQKSKLIAGITAKAQIVLSEAKDTLIVPIASLIAKEDGTYLAVVKDNVIQMVRVETGVESDIQIEVTAPEGSVLEEGMNIVANPNAGMTDGMQVAVMPAG